MGKVVVTANCKGGTGKTLTTYNLATVKAQEGMKVLMIDTDPQGSLGISAGFNETDLDYSYLLFNPGTNPLTLPYETEIDNLNLIPSSINIVFAEVNDAAFNKSIEILKKVYDYIFIDTAPGLNDINTCIMRTADTIMIPVRSDYISFRGYSQLINVLNTYKITANRCVVVTMYESRIKDQQEIMELIQSTKGKYNTEILGTLRKSNDSIVGIKAGLPTVAIKPRCKLSQEFGIIANQI